MNIKIAILEDQKSDYLILSSTLKQWSNKTGNLVNLTWFQSGNEILNSFFSSPFDILFSDIELKSENHFTGIDVCGNLRDLGYSGEIIFLTAFSEYVFQGYNVRAFNYLMKPVEPSALALCLEKYLALHADNYYYLHKGKEISQIRYNDIISICKDGHDVIIQTSNRIYTQRVTLSEVEKRLPSHFLRCHKSCIINMMHVDSIVGNDIYLSNKKTQTVGRNFLSGIRKALIELSQK